MTSALLRSQVPGGRRGRVRADLRAMTGDGIAFGAMVGLGESYLPAFTLALGYGAITAALVATLPMLSGALLQLVTPYAVRWLDSHRRWVTLCAGLQAMSFAPLVAGALIGEIDLRTIYACASLYWGFGMSTGPAWTAWAATLVPQKIRARYFARRASYSQLSLAVALVGAGWMLNAAHESDASLVTFAGVFALAMGTRSVSTFFLWRQSEPQPVPIGESEISLRAIRRHVQTGGHGRLLVYLLVYQLAVWTAAPYFTPYMFGPLEMSYLEFTLITVVAFGARVFSLPLLGRKVAGVGTKRLLTYASACITPLPVLWLISHEVLWLALVQVIGGIAWAAFELASLLSFFERIPPHGKATVLTVYNLLSASAIVLGSAIGSAVFHLVGESGQAFTAVLVLSTSLRLITLPLLRSVPELSKVEGAPVLRTLSVRPSTGGVQRPILTDGEGALES